MTLQMPVWASHREPDRRRRLVRYAAAAISIAAALLYFGIGAGVLRIVDQATPDTPDLFAFGALAGVAFVFGAVLLVTLDHRGLWLLGAIFQIGVIVMYVAVSPQRTPPFEQWGILIKVLQAVLLVALVYLAIRQPARRPARTLRSIV
jgi:peptidoglycan/LPS O-acetylase OafA/YrhL